MHLELRHLKLVAAIAETSSVTLAANKLHLTQSALSHQLRDAEEQLGVPLFERRNRRMALTAAGERLLLSARAVIEELARAEKEIRECNGNGVTKGVLRVSTECYTVYHWLPPRLKLFQHKFPAVDFQLVIEATDSPFEALLEGKLDLAIVCDPIRNRKIRYTPLFEDEVVIIVSPEHRLAGKKFAAPVEFANENLIIYPPKEDSTVLQRPSRELPQIQCRRAKRRCVSGGLCSFPQKFRNHDNQDHDQKNANTGPHPHWTTHQIIPHFCFCSPAAKTAMRMQGSFIFIGSPFLFCFFVSS